METYRSKQLSLAHDFIWQLAHDVLGEILFILWYWGIWRVRHLKFPLYQEFVCVKLWSWDLTRQISQYYSYNNRSFTIECIF